MKLIRPLSLALAALLLAQAAGAANLPLPSREATSSITVRDLKKHLTFLASDELGGRYTLSKSSLIAARYLASELESYGYRGAGPGGSFFQKVPLGYTTPDLTKSRLTLEAGGAKQEFNYGKGFSCETPSNFNISGGLVFVGYGVHSPATGHDDYAALDVRGKVVVMLADMPASLKRVIPEGQVREEAAESRGARGAIIVPPAFILSMWDAIQSTAAREAIGLPPRSTSSGKVFPSVYAGPELIKAISRALGQEESYLLHSGGKPFKPAAIAASAEIKVSVNRRDAPLTQNVVAVLEGADPKLKSEYVVFSAHYDHLESGSNGEVYNGADDDGSGTAAVLEIAEALSVGPRPKRSVLIAFHTGEELGLYGSEYNTDHAPVVPLAKIVANFNIDMIGRSREQGNSDPLDSELTDKDSVYVIGADKLSTELNSISEQTNLETARMKFDYTYNDEKHPQQFYYRSDHYNYAKHGIPIIFYFTGVHRDYHKPTDDVEKLDFEKMARITKMVLATGWRVANLDHRLAVDKKGT